MIGNTGIHLIIGPMFAGKTTTMLAEIERHMIAKQKCVIIKHSSDTRYDNIGAADAITTHAKYTFNDCPVILSTMLMTIDKSQFNHIDVIAISEGQFFPDLPEFADTYVSRGYKIIIEGLNGDFKQKRFDAIADTIPMASTITTVSAVCMSCHSHDAHFTVRLSDEQEQCVVGGSEKYIAVCRNCLSPRV